MDRFDEMRARGINTNDATATAGDILQNKTAYVAGQKITGTYVPSTGSGLKIYSQPNEPEEKSGIWIKQNASIGNTLLSAYYTKQGQFGDYTNYASLETSSDILGQVIVGDILYSFGFGASTSFAYDMVTKQKVGGLNVPNTGASTSWDRVGACHLDGKILVAWREYQSGSSGRIKYYIYDIDTDTYTNIVDYTVSLRNGGNAIGAYNGRWIIFLGSYYQGNSGYFFVGKDGSHTTKVNLGATTYYLRGFSADGKYIYFLQRR